jgi:hypothetical protein
MAAGDRFVSQLPSAVIGTEDHPLASLSLIFF